MKITQSDFNLVCFIVLPFVIGAFANYAPWWVSIPAYVVFGAMWVGTCILIREGKDK